MPEPSARLPTSSRRTVLANMAWTAPAILVAASTPAFAASPQLGKRLTFDYVATNTPAPAYSSGQNQNGYAGFLGILTNIGTDPIPAGVQITVTITISAVAGATRLDQGIWPALDTTRDNSQWNSASPLATQQYVLVITTSVSIAVGSSYTIGAYIRNATYNAGSPSTSTHASAAMKISALPAGVINQGYTTVSAPEIVRPVASLTPSVVRVP